mmetsp:Transcript_247/g.858  ORF Transcript_247/g.858 Transcript_247/m.858 type:complete len:262 (+) Transcript_247:196-981(+)
MGLASQVVPLHVPHPEVGAPFCAIQHPATTMQAIVVQIAVRMHVVKDDYLLPLRPHAEARGAIREVVWTRFAPVRGEVRLAAFIHVAHVHEDGQEAVVGAVGDELQGALVVLIMARIEEVVVRNVPPIIIVLQNLCVLRLQDRQARQVLHSLVQRLEHRVAIRRQEVIRRAPPIVDRPATVRVLYHDGRLCHVRLRLLDHAVALAFPNEGLDLEDPRPQRQCPQPDLWGAWDHGAEGPLEAHAHRRPMPIAPLGQHHGAAA